MSKGYERLMDCLNKASQTETARRGDGWVEPWDVVDLWSWGQNMPVQFVPDAAGKAWEALRRRGWIEESDGLVRPAWWSTKEQSSQCISDEQRFLRIRGGTMSDGATLSLRLPTKKLHAELKRLAKIHDRSINWIVVKACEEYVERAKEPTDE